MELLRIAKLPLEAARFAGHQLLGGAWSELPPLLPTRPTRVPTRAAIHYYSTDPQLQLDIPGNIVIGEE